EKPHTNSLYIQRITKQHFPIQHYLCRTTFFTTSPYHDLMWSYRFLKSVRMSCTSPLGALPRPVISSSMRSKPGGRRGIRLSRWLWRGCRSKWITVQKAVGDAHSFCTAWCSLPTRLANPSTCCIIPTATLECIAQNCPRRITILRSPAMRETTFDVLINPC